MKRTHDTARNRLEDRAAELLGAAHSYNATSGWGSTSNILNLARRYGDALRRVETMRGRK